MWRYLSILNVYLIVTCSSLLVSTDLPNEDIACSIETLWWWSTETEGQETGDNSDDKLHHSKVIQHCDNRAEEHNDGEHLQRQRTSKY